jgi:hypothetical protein
MRRLRHALLLLALLAATAMPVRAEWRDGEYVYTADDTLAAIETHSGLAACIVTYEVGGVGFDPYARGAAGEMGVAQLLPGGMLDVFYARNYSDPFSPYESLDFLDDALARGEGHYWTTYWYCV